MAVPQEVIRQIQPGDKIKNGRVWRTVTNVIVVLECGKKTVPQAEVEDAIIRFGRVTG